MATTDGESLFVDANVLVHATNTRSPWQAVAADVLAEYSDLKA